MDGSWFIYIEGISPKFQMEIIESVKEKLWDLFKSYDKVFYYLEKWKKHDKAFDIDFKDQKVDVCATLHNADFELILKIAVDLGIETPSFIPSIPIIRKQLEFSYETASQIFEKAICSVEEDPNLAIGMANSALESIVKEIRKDIADDFNNKNTLYKQVIDLLKEFKLDTQAEHSIRNITSSLLNIAQSIEKMRSENTIVHGKIGSDYLITDPMYAYLVVNSVSTVGMFLLDYYKKKHKKPEFEDLPF